MENNDRLLLDASAYVAIEATGDSDAGGNLVSQCSEEEPAVVVVVEEDDDAQSASSFGRLFSSGERDEDYEGDGSRVLEEEEDDSGGSDLEDGVVDQCPVKEKVDKSNGSEGLSAKMESEREGDRLFWEACLASKSL